MASLEYLEAEMNTFLNNSLPDSNRRIDYLATLVELEKVRQLQAMGDQLKIANGYLSSIQRQLAG